MRNALSIAAGASVGDEAAEEAVDQQVEVDQAEADRHRQHQQQHPPHPGWRHSKLQLNLNGVLRRSQDGDQQLDQGAGEDPDRVGVDPVLAVEERLEEDQHGDDRQVPEQRRDREGAEAVVAVEDADDDAADPEQDQDREEDLGEGDREVEDLALEAGGEDRHHDRGGEDEEGGDRAQDHGHDQQQGRGEAERLAVVAFCSELLGEDRDEGRLQRGVGEEAADQVGHLEGDREGRHRPADAVVAGGDDLAHQAGDPRGGGGDREEGGRAGDAARLAAGRRLAGRFLAGVEGLGGAHGRRRRRSPRSSSSGVSGALGVSKLGLSRYSRRPPGAGNARPGTRHGQHSLTEEADPTQRARARPRTGCSPAR